MSSACRAHPNKLSATSLAPRSRRAFSLAVATPHYRRARVPLQPLPALVGRGDRPGAERVTLPAGHQQVEQDRAPSVPPRHAKLARSAAGQPRADYEADRKYHDGHSLEGQGCLGYQTAMKAASTSVMRNSTRSDLRETRSTAKGITQSCQG